MTWLCTAFALLGGVVGAGFASGREIVCFFARHGALAGVSVFFALAALCLFLLRIPAQLRRTGCLSLMQLCRHRFGTRLGALCAFLFYLLCAITGGAMLAACAELGALSLPLRHAYALTLIFSLALGMLLCARGVRSLALPGMLLAALLPALLIRLLALPAGEARFLPDASTPFRAAADGLAYGALNAAMLVGCLPRLLHSAGQVRRIVLLFAVLLLSLLVPAVFVCMRHLSAVWDQPLPFVFLGRQLRSPLLISLTLYAAALSTLCAMLSAMAQLTPATPKACLMPAGLSALCFALFGFNRLIRSAYPVLGALCAGLLLLLCMPLPAARNDKSRS